MINPITMKKSFSMIIFTVSILIISIIGFIDTKNNFLEYKLKQFSISTYVEKQKIETSLNKGYGLKMFLGYKRLTQRILSSDNSIIHVSIVNHNNKKVFEPQKFKPSFKNDVLIQNDNNIHIYENKNFYILQTQLKLKDTTYKGHIKTIINKEVLFKDLYENFYWLGLLFIMWNTVSLLLLLLYCFICFKMTKEKNSPTINSYDLLFLDKFYLSSLCCT